MVLMILQVEANSGTMRWIFVLGRHLCCLAIQILSETSNISGSRRQRLGFVYSLHFTVPATLQLK